MKARVLPPPLEHKAAFSGCDVFICEHMRLFWPSLFFFLARLTENMRRLSEYPKHTQTSRKPQWKHIENANFAIFSIHFWSRCLLTTHDYRYCTSGSIEPDFSRNTWTYNFKFEHTKIKILMQLLWLFSRALWVFIGRKKTESTPHICSKPLWIYPLF